MSDLGSLDFAYLTTSGRITGAPHEIEIWFAIDGERVYMLSGGGDRSDWVRNLKRTPEVSVRVGESTFGGHGRIVESLEEDVKARRLLLGKYGPRYAGDLSGWGRSALPVAVDLTRQAGRNEP